MSAVVDARLLLRRADVLEAKLRRYQAMRATMHDGLCRDVVDEICERIWLEQRSVLAYANELQPPSHEYLAGFA